MAGASWNIAIAARTEVVLVGFVRLDASDFGVGPQVGMPLGCHGQLLGTTLARDFVRQHRSGHSHVE